MVSRFTYREAIKEGCFLQVPLFGVDALTRAVGARGLADHPIGLSWEPLDREGLLPPVAYSRIESLASAMHLAALEEGSLILRDEGGYLEWEENGLTPLYAHWQLLSAARLNEALSGRSPLVMLAGGTQQLSRRPAPLAPQPHRGARPTRGVGRESPLRAHPARGQPGSLWLRGAARQPRRAAGDPRPLRDLPLEGHAHH